MVAALADWGIAAGPIDGPDRRLGRRPAAARGRGPEDRLDRHPRRRGITTHGLGINVNNDLQPFEWIVPCGIDACRMTSLAREFGAEQDLAAFGAGLADRLAELLRPSRDRGEAGTRSPGR